jgi:hypothetical protein
MNRILPITSRLRAKWLGNVGFHESASEIVELSPAVDREQPEAISLPSEFNRVVSLQRETTPELESRRLRRGIVRHGPTVAYRLNDSVLGGGSLYFKNGYDVVRSGSGLVLPRLRNQFPEMMFCTNNVIERYFGHWLNDGLALEMLADEMSLGSITFKREPWLHEQGYRNLTKLHAVQTENALVDRLWVVDDRGINDSWISRVRKLRERLRSKIGLAGPKRVMLCRGSLGTERNLVNKAEVEEALQRIGFAIVSPEAESAANLVIMLASAEIVVAVEGSAQSHCTYALPAGATLLTIQPPDRFTAISKDRADAVGLNWSYVVADPRSDGFHLPFDRLLRTFDEISRVISLAKI